MRHRKWYQGLAHPLECCVAERHETQRDNVALKNLGNCGIIQETISEIVIRNGSDTDAENTGVLSINIHAHDTPD